MGLGLRLRVAFVAVFMAVAGCVADDVGPINTLRAAGLDRFGLSRFVGRVELAVRAGTGLDRGHRRLYVGIDFERLAAGVDQEVDLVDRQPEPGGDLVQLRLGWRVEVGEGKVLDYKADTRGRRRS